MPGTMIRDLPPAENNPRNSEGAFLTLPNGEIIFVYSAFKGNSKADHAYTDLKLLRSVDDGLHFTDEGIVLRCEEEPGVNAMSVSLLEMANGDIGLFYLVRTTYTLMQMFLRRSSDGGRSWSERVCCTPKDGYYVVNNDRVTRLSDGRILIPAASHRASSKPDGGFTRESDSFTYDSRAEVIWFCSEDDGRTFFELPGKCALGDLAHCRSGLQEPGVLELSPGLLWGWFRTDLGRQYECYSVDGGLSWTSAQPSAFTSPCSPLSMKRLPDGRICAVWNPVPIYNGRTELPGGIWTGGRTPMVLALSGDNGKTFTPPMVLEEDDSRGFCYCAIHPAREGLLLAYCAGGPEDGNCLCRLRIRRLGWDELPR